MKKTIDHVNIRKIGNHRFEVIISQGFIDEFGKDYFIIKIWNEFPSLELAKKNIDKDWQSMINCGYLLEKRL